MLDNFAIQLEDRPSYPNRTGEEVLWIDVLWVAVDDLRLPTNNPNCSFRWFLSASEEIGSFLWICDQFEISPGYVLRGLSRKLLKHLRNC